MHGGCGVRGKRGSPCSCAVLRSGLQGGDGRGAAGWDSALCCFVPPSWAAQWLNGAELLLPVGSGGCRGGTVPGSGAGGCSNVGAAVSGVHMWACRGCAQRHGDVCRVCTMLCMPLHTSMRVHGAVLHVNACLPAALPTQGNTQVPRCTHVPACSCAVRAHTRLECTCVHPAVLCASTSCCVGARAFGCALHAVCLPCGCCQGGDSGVTLLTSGSTAGRPGRDGVAALVEEDVGAAGAHLVLPHPLHCAVVVAVPAPVQGVAAVRWGRGEGGGSRGQGPPGHPSP